MAKLFVSPQEALLYDWVSGQTLMFAMLTNSPVEEIVVFIWLKVPLVLTL